MEVQTAVCVCGTIQFKGPCV